MAELTIWPLILIEPRLLRSRLKPLEPPKPPKPPEPHWACGRTGCPGWSDCPNLILVLGNESTRSTGSGPLELQHHTEAPTAEETP